MVWVAKTKNDRGKMRPSNSRSEYVSSTLECGHDVYDEPVATGTVTLFRCPDGCGLQKPAPRAA